MVPWVRRGRERMGGWLPHGAALHDDDWRWRHTAVTVLLAAHLPPLVLWALLGGEHAHDVWRVAVPLTLLLAVARVPRLSRSVRSLSATVGILGCSAAVVHLSGDRVEAHFHFFVAVAVIALYQDWAVYALAVAFVLVHHGAVVWLSSGQGSVGSWGWAAVHAVAVVALSVVLVLFWRAHEISRAAADRARDALIAGQDSVQAELRNAEQMRYDLIGTVSHEFRTPLTGIRGNTLTLLQRGERLTPEQTRRMLSQILQQQERLSRLLENMLLAAEATEVDETACADVEALAVELAELHRSKPGVSTEVSVVVEPGLTAHIAPDALSQVLSNLVDNALHHGAPGTWPLVAGGRDADGVWLTVSNEGRVLDLTEKERLFAPFTQLDGGVTRQREGLGVGLFVVKRLVEVYGGSVDVDSHSGWVTVEVRLRPADRAVRAAAPPTSAPATPAAVALKAG